MKVSDRFFEISEKARCLEDIANMLEDKMVFYEDRKIKVSKEHAELRAGEREFNDTMDFKIQILKELCESLIDKL